MAALDRIIEQLRADGRWRRRLPIWLVLGGTALVALVGIGLGTLPEWKHSLAPIGALGVLITLVGGSVLAFVHRGTPDLLADLLQTEAAAKTAAAEATDRAAVLEQNLLALGEDSQLQTDLRSLGDAMLETVE